MVLDACNGAIAAAIGRELSDREKAAVSRRTLELKRKIDMAGNDPLAMESVLGKFAQDIQTQKLIQQRQSAINFRIAQTKDALRKSTQFAQDAPDEFARGQFVQSQKNYFGAKASLGTAVGREADAKTSAFEADLKKAGLFDYAFKSGDDKNIWLARQALNDPAADPAKLSAQYGSQAVQFAQIAAKHQEALRAEQNLAGAWIGRNPDYVTSQTHMPYLLGRAGENNFGSPEAFTAWHDDLGRLDWNKSFDGDLANASPAERTKRLNSVWTQFVAGKHLNFEDAGFGVGAQNLAKKVSQERQLNFQTPSDAYDYWNKYGKQGSVAESIWHDVESGARNVAIMREWGPNAKQNIAAYFDRWNKELVDAGNVKGSQALNAAQNKIEKQYLPTLTDQIGHPDSGFAAHYLQAARQTLLMAKIGASLPSNMGDTVLKASYTQRAGGSFLPELFKSAGRMFTGLSKNDQNTLAQEYAIRLNHTMTPLGANYNELAGTGALSKYVSRVMQISGHSWWSNTFRTGNLAADGFRYQSMAGKEFEQLPQGTQDLMSQFGISKNHWDIMRRSDPLELDDRGTKIMAPSQIRAMDPSEFKSVANGTTDATLKRARDETADRFRNMMGELADTATSAPNRNMRAIINAPAVSMQPWQQELYRSFFGLKGFVGNYMRNHLGGIAMGQDANPNNVGWGRAMARTLTGQNGGKPLAQMASLIAGGVGLGYVKDYLKDFIDGKSPEDPTNFQGGINSSGMDAMKRAFLFQSFGLLSDYVLAPGGGAQQDVWDKVGGLMGPELGEMGKFVDNTTRTGYHLGKWAADSDYTNDDFYKDFGKDAAAWTTQVYHDIPGNNLIWSKAATDYAVLDQLLEMENPGYKQRNAQRLQKTGQTMLLGGGQ